MIVYDSHIFLF